MSLRFQKKVENFICENCGFEVTGNGFTNHCPECLFSKHVDINPGDRSNNCQGLMEPMGIEFKAGEYVIFHKCERCGKIMKIKADKKDNFEKIIELVKLSSIC